jgi:hypothetical protein
MNIEKKLGKARQKSNAYGIRVIDMDSASETCELNKSQFSADDKKTLKKSLTISRRSGESFTAKTIHYFATCNK